MRRFAILAVTANCLGLAVPAGASFADEFPRAPRGIYATIDISDYIKQANLPTEGDDAAIAAFYDSMLDNPAVAGLHLEVHWDFAQPLPPPAPPNWGYIDVAFREAERHGKTIQLDVTAGFNSPAWVWDANQSTGIPSCDPLFASPPEPAPNCGTVTFSYYAERTDQDGNGNKLVLPLPWNRTYVSRWHEFLAALQARYGFNHLLVAVTMAGPTAASPEMILPNNFNTCPNNVNGPCLQKNGRSAEDMWNTLFQNTSPDPSRPYATNSDEAFVDQWISTIDFYERLFSGVTLVITPGAGTGFPSFESGFPFKPSPENVLYHPECDYSDTGGSTYIDHNHQTRSCDAATTILTYFMNTFGGPHRDGMASETAGMEASDPFTLGNFTPHGTTGDVGVAGVKYLSTYSFVPELPAREIAGGAQFDHAFSGGTTVQEGCPQGINGCSGGLSPTQAAYNVLQEFFRGTPGALRFGGPALAGNERTPRFLEVFNQDVTYAQMPTSCPVPITDPTTGATFEASAQELLNMASASLFAQEFGFPRPNGLRPWRGPCRD
jgi:hypothetical protein